MSLANAKAGLRVIDEQVDHEAVDRLFIVFARHEVTFIPSRPH